MSTTSAYDRRPTAEDSSATGRLLDASGPLTLRQCHGAVDAFGVVSFQLVMS